MTPLLDRFWTDFWSLAVPTWVTGVGTLGLAVVAFLDGRATRKENQELRQEVRDERDKADRLSAEEAQRRKKAEERAQAEQVVVWSDRANSGDGRLVGDDTSFRARGTVIAAWVANHSAAPITNVEVKWVHLEGSGVITSRTIALVPPEQDRGYVRPVQFDRGNWPDVMPLELVFKDARGRTWSRGRTGELDLLSAGEGLDQPGSDQA